jgi:hypothetical protein
VRLSNKEAPGVVCVAKRATLLVLVVPVAGMLGTAAITITSPTADAAAAHQSAAAADPTQQQSSEAGGSSSSSSSSQSLSDAEACSGSRGAAAARDPTINSGCATPASVRQQQQISGLVPPRQVELSSAACRATTVFGR